MTSRYVVTDDATGIEIEPGFPYYRVEVHQYDRPFGVHVWDFLRLEDVFSRIANLDYKVKEFRIVLR